MTQVASFPAMKIEAPQQNSYQVWQVPEEIFPQRKNLVDAREHRLFEALDQEKKGVIFPGQLKKGLTQMGLKLR